MIDEKTSVTTFEGFAEKITDKLAMFTHKRNVPKETFEKILQSITEGISKEIVEGIRKKKLNKL